jgi:hypothetical protein
VTLHMQSHSQTAILVFLPERAAHVIVSTLNENGYAATAASSMPALTSALRSAKYFLAVTTQRNIGIVRNIRSLPVVNLEIFFYPVSFTGSLISSGDQFDSKAFLQRVKFLIEARPHSTNSIGVRPVY